MQLLQTQALVLLSWCAASSLEVEHSAQKQLVSLPGEF